MDNTSQKIIDAAMKLVRDKGYVSTTTKDIARLAGVNECTLFRKFQNKKDIILQGISQEKWRAGITPEIFQNVQWELEPDLEMFMNIYMDRITTDFVNLSIGLRAPQIYNETSPFIIKIPSVFLSFLIEYFNKMKESGKISNLDSELLAMTIFSSTFGYTFLNSSFSQNLTKISKEEFVKKSVKMFVNGILSL